MCCGASTPQNRALADQRDVLGLSGKRPSKLFIEQTRSQKRVYVQDRRPLRRTAVIGTLQPFPSGRLTAALSRSRGGEP